MQHSNNNTSNINIFKTTTVSNTQSSQSYPLKLPSPNPSPSPSPFPSPSPSPSLNPSPPSSSFLSSKRQQFKSNIRKQYLQNLFSSKRKQLLQQTINEQQKQKTLKYIEELLSYFFKSTSVPQGEEIITKISQQLNRESHNNNNMNTNTKQVITQYSSQLLKCFITYPRHKQSLNILYRMIAYCYEDTFDVDDRKFIMLNKEDVYTVRLEYKELTDCQQAMFVLMAVSDQLIDGLEGNYVVMDQKYSQEDYNNLQQHQQQSIQKTHHHNYKLQKRINKYLYCFKQLVSKMNCYILRTEFISRYLTKWAYKLLVEYQFEKTAIMTYLLFVSRQVVPFKVFVDQSKVGESAYYQGLFANDCKGNNNNNNQNNNNHNHNQNNNSISNNNNTIYNNPLLLQQIQDKIITQLFTQCLPTTTDISKDRVPFFSMIVIKQLFSYYQIKTSKIIQFLEPLCYLLRVVLNHRKYFRPSSVDSMFEFFVMLVARFNQCAVGQESSEEDRKLVQQVNLVELFSEMEFIAIFDLFFNMENQSFCQPIYQLVCHLIEYCLIYNIDLSLLVYQKSIFPTLCHKLDSPNQKILYSSLRSIQMICQYAQKQNKRQYFVKMVNYGIDNRLDHMVFHMNEFVAQGARNLQELYFTQEQIYNYTELESQLQRYDYKQYKQDYYYE